VKGDLLRCRIGPKAPKDLVWNRWVPTVEKQKIHTKRKINETNNNKICAIARIWTNDTAIWQLHRVLFQGLFNVQSGNPLKTPIQNYFIKR